MFELQRKIMLRIHNVHFFEYNDTDIKFIIFDIEKFPLNLKEEEYIENKVNDTNKKENDKIKQSEIKNFEFFLNTFYLPSFNLCLNTFYSNTCIMESLKVKYDRALVKIIESLLFSLKNILNVETDLLKEELLNSLNRKLLSDRMSFLIFDIFTKFSFGNQALSKKPRYYSLFYSGIQNWMDNTLSFINNSDFFKKIKHMYLIDPKKCDRFRLASIDIVNLRSIILFEYMKSYSFIDISEDFLLLLYKATENEIYEGNKIPFTLVETMSRKELPLGSILNLDNQPIGEFKSIFFDFFSSTVYEYFIYKFYGIISQNKIVDISNLQIKNSRSKEINSLKLFLNYRIRKIKISNCDINLRFLKIIFEFKFLKDLTLSEVEILIDKNEIINFFAYYTTIIITESLTLSNNSILEFKNGTTDIISPKIQHLNFKNFNLNAENQNIFSHLKKLKSLKISNCKFDNIYFCNIFDTSTEYSITEIYFEEIFLYSNDILFLKTLPILKKLTFKNCEFNCDCFKLITSKNLKNLSKISCFYTSEYENSETIINYFKEEFSNDMLDFIHVFNLNLS
ncbi:hypothetical protein CWI39_1659p0010 [Hamiltosporidium magnivora]|uniref:Uncharacterized protein n=1 Tax=Hamiltosporidium magnivora TaxID=148818 RepID=A0A4Q9L211_9MICR|nr:hypothetical protein CWI39_1659p0010 [Hamiltosporidium magnivora]